MHKMPKRKEYEMTQTNNQRVKRKIVKWFKKWYGYSWVDKKAKASQEIIEIKKILGELK